MGGIIENLKTFYFKNKIRLGNNKDGGYVIADIGNYDLYISCGIGDDESFSNDIIKKYEIDNSIAFDGTIEKLPENFPSSMKFVEKNIDENNLLIDLLKNHSDIFLKMDIEGSEIYWILNTDGISRIKQMVIEFHKLFLNRKEIVKCLEILNETHYIIHCHGNNYSSLSEDNLPDVIEITFIRKDYLKDPILNYLSLPSILDFPNNPNFPDIDLNYYPFTIINRIRNIKSFCIKGERCSGTNYLEKIIEKNLKLKYENKLGWKHSYLNTFENNLNYNDFLTIVIFRNVYDWLLSFYRNPHHLNFNDYSFSQFIRMSPVGFEDGKEMLKDRHPFTLEWPNNIIELRNWKNENYLNHEKIISNIYYIRYEDLYNNTEKVIRDINKDFLNKDFHFIEHDLYKKTENKFFEKKYNSISDEDFEFILNNLNWDLENKLGYSKESFIKEHNERKTYTQERKEDITSLYREIFEREPDHEGFHYWLESGFSIDYIKNYFLNCTEYKELKK